MQKIKKRSGTPQIVEKEENQNHPSNGWFAQGLKAQYYRPATQVAGFRILKPIAFATFAAPQGAFVLLATLKRVFVLFYT